MIVADIGEGIAEIEVKHWYVKEGDLIKEFEPLCDAKSDKASVTITSRYTGRVRKLCFNVDDSAPVGSALVEIEVDPANLAAHHSTHQPAPIASTASPTAAHDDAGRAAATSPPFAAPGVRRFALENQVNIQHVTPSRSDQRITREDVLAHLRHSRPDSERATSSPSLRAARAQDNNHDEVVLELKGYHRVMFRTMTESLHIPHLMLSDSVDVTALITDIKATTPRVPFLAFFLKAVSLALAQYPKLNSSILSGDAAGGIHIVLKKRHNIGIAVDTIHGLAVPVVANVHTKSPLEIAAEIELLVEHARQDRLSEAHISDATFTVSNIGSIGGSCFSPIVVPPQVGLLALGRVQPRADEASAANHSAAHLLPLSLAADHRVIDGATAARFIAAVATYLRSPLTLVGQLR